MNFRILSLFPVVAFLLLFSNKSLFAQGEAVSGESNYSGLSPLYPPSPNSASLGFFGNYQVDQFTGVADISVPIYEILQGDFKLPISLSYSHNSVKVNTMASWVGLGWSLNAGGVITRVVRDINDDNSGNGGRGYGMMYPTEFLYGEGTSPGNPSFGRAYERIESVAEENSCATAWNLLGLKAGFNGFKAFDTEPDIFYFNFKGRSGRFVIDKNLKPGLIPFQDLSISFETVETVPASENENPNRGWIKSFTIIDENGVKYIFSDVELTEVRGYHEDYWLDFVLHQWLIGDQFYMTYNSSWYLTKIILPNTDEIQFSYESELYHYYEPSSNSYRNCPDQDCENSVTAEFEHQLNFPQNSTHNVSYRMYGKRLTRITFKEGYLEFVGNNTRNDLGGTKSLDQILLYNDYRLVRKFNLGYKYFTCDNNEPDLLRWPQSGFFTDYNNSFKLCLKNLIETGSFGIEQKKHEFEYDERVNIPRVGSYQQDFWGYYNRNGAKTLVPRIYIYPAETGASRYRVFPIYTYAGAKYDLSGAHRFANPDYLTIGTLNRIKFPTGGFTDFELEPNEFELTTRFSSGAETYTFLGGGMRIKKVTSQDGVSAANNIIREYEYTESNGEGQTHSTGRLLSMPIFGYVENTGGYFVKVNNAVNPLDFPNAYSQSFYQYFLTRLTSPSQTLNGQDGVIVAYKSLTEKVANGKIIYKFSIPAVYPDNDDINGSACSITENGICDGVFSPAKSFYCEMPNFHLNCNPGLPQYGNRDPDLKGMDNGNMSYSYPYAPNLNYEWNRGKLLNKSEYDNSGRLVREKKYFYKTFTPDNQPPAYVTGMSLRYSGNWKLDYNGSNFEGGPGAVFLFSKYKIVTGIAKVLDSTYEQVLNYSGLGTQWISNSQKLMYKPKNLLVEKQLTSSSIGQKLSKEFNYVVDYISEYPFNLMYAKHNLAGLVSTTTNINSAKKEVNLFKYQELSNSNFVRSEHLKALSDNIPESEVKVSSFSSSGYPLNIIERSGIYTTYLRDNLNNIVAVAEGPTQADISFTSFESNDNSSFVTPSTV